MSSALADHYSLEVLTIAGFEKRNQPTILVRQMLNYHTQTRDGFLECLDVNYQERGV